MSREILFRGKRVDNDEWAEGGYFYHYPTTNFKRCYIVPVRNTKIDAYEISVSEDTVGQFTGLTDKNGVKIFEGDIVKDTDYAFHNERIAKVVYSTHFQRLQLVFIKGEECFLRYGDMGICIFDWVSPKMALEVIGNIHDNPELLCTDELKP